MNHGNNRTLENHLEDWQALRPVAGRVLSAARTQRQHVFGQAAYSSLCTTDMVDETIFLDYQVVSAKLNAKFLTVLQKFDPVS